MQLTGLLLCAGGTAPPVPRKTHEHLFTAAERKQPADIWPVQFSASAPMRSPVTHHLLQR